MAAGAGWQVQAWRLGERMAELELGTARAALAAEKAGRALANERLGRLEAVEREALRRDQLRAEYEGMVDHALEQYMENDAAAGDCLDLAGVRGFNATARGPVSGDSEP